MPTGRRPAALAQVLVLALIFVTAVAHKHEHKQDHMDPADAKQLRRSMAIGSVFVVSLFVALFVWALWRDPKAAHSESHVFSEHPLCLQPTWANSSVERVTALLLYVVAALSLTFTVLANLPHALHHPAFHIGPVVALLLIPVHGLLCGLLKDSRGKRAPTHVHAAAVAVPKKSMLSPLERGSSAETAEVQEQEQEDAKKVEETRRRRKRTPSQANPLFSRLLCVFIFVGSIVAGCHFGMQLTPGVVRFCLDTWGFCLAVEWCVAKPAVLACTGLIRRWGRRKSTAVTKSEN